MAMSDPFKPYVNTINAKDPMVKKVPMDSMDIASNAAGMPKGMMNSEASIQHVGNANSK